MTIDPKPLKILNLERFALPQTAASGQATPQSRFEQTARSLIEEYGSLIRLL